MVNTALISFYRTKTRSTLISNNKDMNEKVLLYFETSGWFIFLILFVNHVTYIYKIYEMLLGFI